MHARLTVPGCIPTGAIPIQNAKKSEIKTSAKYKTSKKLQINQHMKQENLFLLHYPNPQRYCFVGAAKAKINIAEQK